MGEVAIGRWRPQAAKKTLNSNNKGKSRYVFKADLPQGGARCLRSLSILAN